MPLFEPRALKTVRAWFAAHSRGDLEAARSLFADTGILHVSSLDPAASGEVIGFDAFLGWYADRRGRASGLEYRLDDLLGNDDRVVAILTLRDEHRQWRQVAVYEVADRQIREIWVFEGGP